MATQREALWILLISLLVPGTDGTATMFTATYENNITVSPKGKDNGTCLRGENPCETLEYPLHPVHLKNSTKVTILSGSYNLSTELSFEWLEDFALFAASDENITVQCNETGAGLSFQKSKNLLFQGIVFKGCGSLHESTTGNAWVNFTRAKFYAGLFLVASTNLSVRNCTFRDSPGTAVNLYDVGGIVVFSHSRFVKNGPDTREKNHTTGIAEAGGGLYIEFTAQGYDASGVNFPVKNSYYSVSDCHFVSNHAPQPRYENYTTMNTTGNRHSPFGRGGGVSIFLMGTTEGNMIRIDGCVFQENNASWGGGVFFELHEQAQNTSLNITHSRFEKNWVRNGGGGTRTGSITTESSQILTANRIVYENCTFSENRAIFGGGVSHYGQTYLPASNTDRRRVYFKDCIWNGNRATAGSALGLNVFSESQIREHPLVPFYVTLEMCSIRNNQIVHTEDFVVNGYGALYTNAAHLKFKGDVTFKNNINMTALLLDNAFVYVYNKTVFVNNSGEFGGAVALYGESRIITWSGSELLFENNHARSLGGAIYFRAPGPPMVPFKTRYLDIHECFLAFEDLTQNDVEKWNTKITFKNNSCAPEGTSNSVYATTLQSCYKHNETREKNHALMWPNVVEFTSNRSSEISTDPVSIKIVQNEWQGLSPSQLFAPSVFLTDERSQRSPGTVEIKIVQQDHCDVKLDVPSSLFIVQKNGTINGLKLTGSLGCSFMVQLKSPAGQQFLQPAPFRVNLRNRCHPGFEIKDNNTCKCMNKTQHRGISRCGEDGKSVYLKRGYWFGKVQKAHSYVYDTYPCPKHYCNKTYMISESTECRNENNTDDFLYDNTTMCAENRTGTLCGSCKTGYTVHLGDEGCSLTHSNSNLWIYGAAFFIGALIIVLFLLLIPHLDIFASYLNALLFSFQVMDALVIERDRPDVAIAGVMRLAHWRAPTSAGFPLFSGMTDLTKFYINYVMPVYILIILVVLMFVTKCRRTVYFGENVFQAFCALIVLCYTNVTDITFNIFDYVQLGGRSVLFLDGDMKDDKNRLALTIIAGLFCVFFILPVPAILLYRPGCIERYGLRFLSNICDAFDGCYRQGYEWFAAFYFICRIVLIVLSKFLPRGEFLPLNRSILEASTILMVVILISVRPYRDEFSVLNTTDAVLLVNLSFITVFSTSFVISSSKEVHCAAWVIVDVLCWCPVAVLIYLMFRYRQTLCQKLRELRTWISNKLTRCCTWACGNDNEEDKIIEEPTSTSG